MTDTSKEQIDHLLGFLDSDRKVLCHNAAAVIRALVERAEKAEAERDVTRKELGLKHDEANRYVNELLDTKTRVKVLEEAILAICAAIDEYVPPDGIDANECISRIFNATDNPKINPVIFSARAALENKP
jgi:hypothetical protein